MADEKVAISVEVQGVDKSISSVKDLKNAIKDARNEQVKMSEAFGENSVEAVKAAKRVAELKDKVEDLSDSTKSLGGTGLERASAGMSQFGEGLKNLDFQKVKVGLTAMKTALAAVGIGLVVQLVSYLIENFDNLSKGSGGLAKSLRFVADIMGTIVETGEKVLNFFTDLIGISSEAERAVEKQGEAFVKASSSSKDAIANQTAEYDRLIGVAKASGKSTVDLEIAKQQAIIDTNKALLEQALAYVKSGGVVSAEQRKLIDEQINAVKTASTNIQNIKATEAKRVADENTKAYEKKKAEDEKSKQDNLTALQQLEDAKIANETNEEQRAIDTAIKEKKRRDESINNLKVSQDIKDALLIQSQTTLQNSLTAIDNKAEAERKAINDKAIADKKAQDDKALADKIAKEKAITEQTNTENLARAELNVLNNKNSVDSQIAFLQTKRDIELQNTELTESQVALIKAKYTEQSNELERQAKVKTVQQGLELTKTSLEGAQALSDTFFAFKMAKVKKGSAEEEALAKKQFEINKAMNLGMAVINGVQSVLAITSVPDFTLGVATAIRIGAQVALTAASIAKIATTKFGSTSGGGVSGGGGGSAPSTSIPNAPTISNPNANVNGSQFDEQGNKINNNNQTITVNATIGVDEVSSKQHRVAVLENQAKF